MSKARTIFGAAIVVALSISIAVVDFAEGAAGGKSDRRGGADRDHAWGEPPDWAPGRGPRDLAQEPEVWRIREALPAPTMEQDPDAVVVDVAREAALTPPTSADLLPTIDVQITQEIIDKAAELGTAEAMYQFVRNECEFQAYYGSQKGSVETLRQRAGNDYDLASLLIALLRASGIYARYAEGQVEMSVEEVENWLVVDDAEVAGSILYTNGMEGISLISATTDCCYGNGTPGCDDEAIEACVCATDPYCCDYEWDQTCAGEVDSFGCAVCDDLTEVVAVRAHRIWVEAYVPRAFSSPAWVPLDPAFALTEIQHGLDIPEEMGFDAQLFIDEYWGPSDPEVVLPRPETPVELFVQEIDEYLDANHPGTTLADVNRTHAIIPENLEILPASLPYTVRSRDGEFPEIAADRRYQVRFHMYDGATTLIDHTFDLPAIAGRRVSIDYVGATASDEATIDSYGGIYETPPWLVDLKPVLRLDGTDVATGAAGVGMGLRHRSDVHFLAPANSSGLPQNVVPSISNTITTGASQVIGLAIEGVAERLLAPPPDDDTEGLAALRHDIAMDYLSRCRDGDVRLGRLMHAYVTTDVSNAIVENVVNVTTDIYGDPQTFEWTGVRVDADRSVLGFWPVDRYPPGAEAKDLMILAGAEGSLHESLVYEDSYAQDSVSTIKLLQLAHDAGVTVYKRWNTLPLPANTLSAADRLALQDAIASGREVTFPADPMTVGAPETGQWTGTGWIAMDPATGAAGYIISGGNNGGATYEVWPPEFIDLSEDDRSIRDVQIEIVRPAGDSPNAEAVFTRDNEEHLVFEYRVHVTYDDLSTATLPGGDGTYRRETTNTTKTFAPGNYTFSIWIGRTVYWLFLETIAYEEVDVSIVGVLIRGPDGVFDLLPCNASPPEFVPILPAASGFPGLALQACVFPARDPSGGPMALGYTWSGGAKVAFSSTTTRETHLQTAVGATASVALADQDVDLVVDLPGGKTVHGYESFDFTEGSSDEEVDVTVYSVTMAHPDPPPLSVPADANNIGNEFTFTAADPGRVTVRCEANVEPLLDEVKDHVDPIIKWEIESVSTFLGIGGWSWTDSWGLLGGAGQGHGIDTPLEATETDLPSSNDDFGVKAVDLSLKVDGTLYVAASRDIEVFFTGDAATNHPGGEDTDTNWYHYWSEALGVRDEHTYDPNAATSTTVVNSATDWAIVIAPVAYWPGGNWPTNEPYIDGFWATNLHEFWHRDHRVHNFEIHGDWNPPPEDDIDGDGICSREPGDPVGDHTGGWEARIGTDPFVANSTEDGANWAELNGAYGNDPLDWAAPGSQFGP